jgi:hypothetical protein
VPLGTMIADVSFRPPDSPVIAVTVTNDVIGVPEFVMKAFEPLMTQ